MNFRLIQIQTTPKCNARCLCCPHSISELGSENGIMSDTLYKNIVNQIAELDPEFSGRFCPYLMNEPFVDFRLEKFIEFTYSKLPNMELEVSTNAELMSPKRSKKLIDIMRKYNKNERSRIKISIHGCDEQSVYDFMGISLKQAAKNVRELVRYNNGDFPIRIWGLGYSLDGEYHHFNRGRYLRFWHKELIGLNFRNVLIQYGSFHTRAGNVKISGWKYNKNIRKIDRDHPFDCPRLHNSLHVLYDGTCVPCCMCYNREGQFGNLNYQSINEIFKTKEWIDFYEKARGLKESSDDFICKRCDSPGG